MIEDPSKRKVVLLALECLEPSLVREGVDEGWLPSLGKFLGRGRSVLLNGPHMLSLFSAWPGAITGSDPAEHGLFNDFQLRPGSYSVAHIKESDLRVPPFWRYVSDAGLSSTICDFFCAVPLADFNGTQVQGWGTLGPYIPGIAPAGSQPSEILARLEREVPGRSVAYLRESPRNIREYAGMRDEGAAQTARRLFLPPEGACLKPRIRCSRGTARTPGNGLRQFWNGFMLVAPAHHLAAHAPTADFLLRGRIWTGTNPILRQSYLVECASVAGGDGP